MKITTRKIRDAARLWLVNLNYNHGRGDIQDVKFNKDGTGYVARRLQYGSDIRKFVLYIKPAAFTKGPTITLSFLRHRKVIFSHGDFNE